MLCNPAHLERKVCTLSLSDRGEESWGPNKGEILEAFLLSFFLESCLLIRSHVAGGVEFSSC
jgi:hypothetical protein